ncbi:putative multidrug export ATP-binding/permease protein [bacterium MnTg02]|nr:putative multidrug export ATP-binding/permease protein [bacterium MnTg02]
MFRWFENLIDPFKTNDGAQPPQSLLGFYWYYVRQVRLVFLAAMATGFLAAIVEVSLFAFLGQIVDMVKDAQDTATFFEVHGNVLLLMALVALVGRPILFFFHNLTVDQAINPGFTNLIRWQTHRYVSRQSLSFFNNDFAGRIASKIMQTGPSLRESVVQSVDALWFVCIYTVSALALFVQLDMRLALPLFIWIFAFSGVLVFFVPRIKNRSTKASESRSTLTGRIVDSYTNILTLKLFANTELEDNYTRSAMADLVDKFRLLARMITVMDFAVWTVNGFLIVGTSGLALWLWSKGLITVGAIALAVALVIRINNMAGWIMWVVTGIFENIGRVQEGMETISLPHGVVDAPAAKQLIVPDGEIRYDAIRFHYGRDAGVIDDLSLTIKPGERVGLVGRSGAGKSTLVNLLFRFYDLERGRILIDGQDIANVTQDSLRAAIGMVTQDTSLLHRSVMENILYGRPDASEAEAIAAAKQAHAHEFILDLEDLYGRKGYDAQVGERGVKLSGGQRQRVAIARVLLKDAPILILDEATSALDSEVEAAIQEQFYTLMEGKTVIAIAHRLSTISAMDRLIIMDEGRIIEEGSHDELVKRGGLYAQLWARQSGGFLPHETAA